MPYVELVTAADLAALTVDSSPEGEDGWHRAAAEITNSVIAGYVRGRGLPPPTDPPLPVPADLRSVALLVGLRLVRSFIPAETTGPEGEANSTPGPGFRGFTLLEQTILHGYRRRSA